jgi:hypothetical protein
MRHFTEAELIRIDTLARKELRVDDPIFVANHTGKLKELTYKMDIPYERGGADHLYHKIQELIEAVRSTMA